jgi:hypothetical protein
MAYEPGDLEKRVKEIRKSIVWGQGAITFALGLGLLSTEIKKILSLPHQLSDVLYLALLIAIGIKVALWIWVSQKELALFCQWLDPEDYEPPDETIIIVGFAVVLAILLYAARNPIVFGVAYTVYSVANVLGWIHVRGEIGTAVTKSRLRLKEEKPSEQAGIIEQALALIERYYVRAPHIARSSLGLILAITGLAISTYGGLRHNQTATEAAYLVYIFDTLIIEELGTMRLRLAFYAGLRPLSAKVHDLTRKGQEPGQ